MTAFQSMRLSAQGAPETPKGGSEDRRLKSRIRRRRQAVDWKRRRERRLTKREKKWEISFYRERREWWFERGLPC